MLEARENAEKVGYPVVGEEIKDASNVIDYNINEEITKDASGVINANNQTTTGMATVTPGINAPKLIANTSITGIDVDPEGSYYGTLVAESYTGTITAPPGTTPDYPSKTPTIISNTLPYNFGTNTKGLVFPRGGGYNIVVRYFGMGQSDYVRYDTLYLNNEVVGTHSGYAATDITYQLNIKKGDVLWFTTYIYNSFPNTTTTKNPGVRYTITPK